MIRKEFYAVVIFFVLLLGIVSAEQKIDSEVYKSLEKEKTTSVVIEVKDNQVINKIDKEDIIRVSGNLVTANVTSKDIENLKQISDIKNIEPSVSFRAMLSDSAGIVNATRVWSLIEGGENLTGEGESVCIIDSGVDFTHADLTGKNRTCVIDCFNKECSENCSVGDDFGHGTHVAGIVSANGGVKGIASGAGLIALKVLDENGDSSQTGVTDLKNAIDWCVQNKDNYNISVISMSLGTTNLYTGYCDSSFSSSLTKAINNATAYNISVVSATGNSGTGVPRNTTSISAPACIENSTAVSATNKDDSISSYGHYNNITDLFAPGTSINSTYLSGGYAVLSGTSMATPHVSGALAILHQFYRKERGNEGVPSELERALKNNGKNITASEMNFTRINVYGAIISLDNSAPPVYLEYPESGAVNISSNQTFICNSTDLSLRNMTFYLWNSSGIVNETFNEISGSNYTSSLEIYNLEYGEYEWNCDYYDENGNKGFSAQNSTLRVGGVFAQRGGIERYTNLSDKNFSCLSESEDSYILENSTFIIWKNGVLLYNATENIVGNSNESFFEYNLTEEGEYEWNCEASNNNSDFYRSADNGTISYDISAPNVSWTYPDEGYSTSSSGNEFRYNVSDSSIDSCRLIVDSAVIGKNESSNGTIYTEIGVGEHQWQFSCNDTAGNYGFSEAKSMIITQSVSSSGGGGGGGGGAAISSSNTYNPTNEDIDGGYSKELRKNDRIQFKDSIGENHTLSVDYVGADYANITIRSSVIKITLGIGQSAKINLTSSEKYDYYVMLEGIENGKAQILLERIDEFINPSFDNNVEEEKAEEISKSGEESRKNNWKIIITAIGAVFVIAILLKRRLNLGEREKKGRKTND